MQKITRAVIPVAGLGTRFLPATKAMPKEMLPVVDKPVIQFVVEEAVRAHANHILMVTGRNKHALENHFDRAFELESRLIENGDERKLSYVEESTELADIHYVRQGDALGLGHAVSKARTFVGGEPFVLLLGDEIIDDDGELLEEMIQLAASEGANVVALLEVSDEEVHKYGIATIKEDIGERVVHISALVEKPAKKDAPSNYAVVGRYVLQPGVFDILDGLNPGVAGEIQLTDALNAMAQNPELAGPMLGVVLTGNRLDMGTQLSFMQAAVTIASRREDIGDDFRAWLKEFNNQ